MDTHKVFTLILVFLVSFLITSCASKGSAVLQDTNCPVPCWRNIEVGRTGIESTIQLLNQMPDVEPGSIRQGKKPNSLVEVVTASFIDKKEISLEITFQDEKVVSIYFSYLDDILLSDAIKKYGEPKYIYPSALKGDPTVYLTVNFLYPDLGICLHHQNKGLILKLPETYKVNESTNISRIYYVDPSLPQGQIKYGCLSGSTERELEINKVDWKGFMEYPIP